MQRLVKAVAMVLCDTILVELCENAYSPDREPETDQSLI